MITVSVVITGVDGVVNQLQHLKDILGDFIPEMELIGNYLMDFFTNSVFNTEGSVFGHPWASLSPDYAVRKAARWGATRILIASGQMRASYKLYTASDYLIIRNEDPISAYHQTGSGRLPQRTMMDFDSDMLTQIASIANQSLNQRISSL